MRRDGTVLYSAALVPGSSLAIFACFLCLSLPLASGRSDAPVHYYDAAIGKTGPALKATLQSLIRNHRVIPYTSTLTDTWDAVKVLDEDPTNADNVLLIYSGFAALKSDQFTGTSGSWEREHLWPQSYGITAISGNSRARNDLFNLRPISRSVNGSRGNKYYDVSVPPISTYPLAPGSSADNNSWEPRPSEKGTIARAMFYMAVRYDGSDADVPDLELAETPDIDAYRFGKLSTLLAWHRQSPVTAAERARNEAIYAFYQHNRDPFIDHPEWAGMVFAGLSHLDSWLQLHFSDAEFAAPQISADAADPDGDGIATLLEYLFNSDPRAPEAGAAIAESVTSQGAAESVALTFAHNRNATDVGLSYEGSSDGKNWTAIAPNQITTAATDAETEEITARFLVSAPVYFLRLKAAQ